MRTNKNTSKIILAATVAILATMISYSAFSNMRNQMSEQQKMIDAMQTAKGGNQAVSDYAYAIATANLTAGEIVSDQDVDFKQFDIENKDAFENRSDVVNKVLLKSIAAGETFNTSHIARISNDDVTLKEGYRALTLPADNFQGKSETMKAGSVIDIYSTAVDSNWVLEGVKIMSFGVGNSAAPGAAPATPDIMNASSITFEVATEDISSFISNISKGKLMLVTRSANEKPVRKKAKHSNFSGGSYAALPNLPTSVPITNLSAPSSKDASNLSGLPQPIQPTVQQPSVEVIEANVKSKVTFD